MKVNNFGKFFIGVAAFGLAACSNDEPAPGNQGNNKFEGDYAYITVNLRGADNMSRSTTSPGYENDENVGKDNYVQSAHFYFFEDNGAYYAEASVWSDGTVQPEGSNVEFKSNTQIVLEQIKDRTVPKYLLTVLNQPANFEVGRTLEDTRNILLNCLNEDKNFVMSTTSFYADGYKDGTPYYVTEIEASDFALEPDGEATPVEIYVERLAAKVNVDVDSKELKDQIKFEDGSVGYRLEVTVSGNPNEEIGDTDAGATEVYVKFANWGLNGTAVNSYLSKNLDGWYNHNFAPFTYAFADWNIPGDFRSYWAKSTVYNQELTEANFNTAKLTLNVLDTPFGTANYCNETTNARENIVRTYTGDLGEPKTVVDPEKVTSAFLAAQVVDKNNKPLDLVLYNGVYRTWDAFKRHLLDQWNLPLYTCETVGTDNAYNQLDENFFVFESKGDATGSVVLAFENPADNNLPIAIKKDGAYIVLDLNKAEDLKQIQDLLDAKQASMARATAYNKGWMFYSVPVQHLNATTDPVEGNNINEGAYGVVRNHSYKLTISKIYHLGNGVFDPDEALIPTDPDPTYY
ncbi:MAG: fimbria major subunit, partial [Muribaculaceae bacterium]|nr:fimbria major subunit [Muribaculaceae bacterium]